MTRSRYRGPFAQMIGEEDLLQPTQRRLLWLLVGLLTAALVGFAAGLLQPRPQMKNVRDREQ